MLHEQKSVQEQVRGHPLMIEEEKSIGIDQLSQDDFQVVEARDSGRGQVCLPHVNKRQEVDRSDFDQLSLR